MSLISSKVNVTHVQSEEFDFTTFDVRLQQIQNFSYAENPNQSQCVYRYKYDILLFYIEKYQLLLFQ